MRSTLLVILAGWLAVAPASARADALSVLPGRTRLAPLLREGEPRRYTPDNLWEKINGEAEQYKRFGLVEAASAFFTKSDDPERTLEVTVFALDSPLAAFGLFAGYRSSSSGEMKGVNGGSMGSNQAVFWHGSTFVLIDAFGAEGRRLDDMKKAIDAVVGSLGPPPRAPAILTAFEAVVQPRTVAYSPDHLIGREVFPPGLEGITGDSLRVFLCAVPVTEPSAILAGYQRVLRESSTVSFEGAKGITGYDPSLGWVTVAVRGKSLAGARHKAETPGLAETLGRLLAIPLP